MILQIVLNRVFTETPRTIADYAKALIPVSASQEATGQSMDHSQGGVKIYVTPMIRDSVVLAAHLIMILWKTAGTFHMGIAIHLEKEILEISSILAFSLILRLKTIGSP